MQSAQLLKSQTRGFTLIRLPLLRKRSCKGFTLIELMVVISVIGILSGIGLTVYSGVQKSGRITKRIGDMKSVAAALESYKAANGSYPIAPPWRTANGCGGYTQVSPNDAIPGLAPQYIIAMPTDPSMNNTGHSCYLYYSDGSDYKFLVHDVAEMTYADYLRQPNYVDPARDRRGGDGNIVDGASPWSWAIWTDGFRSR